MSLDPQQTAVVKAPVGPKAAFDAVKERGVHGYDETSGCPTICPGNGLDYVRSTIHPDDASPASPLSGSETVTILQAGALVTITVQELAGLLASGSYQPWDSDLTAIAALDTQTFGRSLLTAASAGAGLGLLGISRELAQAQIGSAGSEEDWGTFTFDTSREFEIFCYPSGAGSNPIVRMYDGGSKFAEVAISGYTSIRLVSFGGDGFLVVNGGTPTLAVRADLNGFSGNVRITGQGVGAGSYVAFRKLTIW